MGNAIELILSDIDGTILPAGQPYVSERTADVFSAALAAGYRVGPASGRARAWMVPFLRGRDELCTTALATNGMEVYLDGELIHRETVAYGLLEELAAEMAKTPHAGLVGFDEGVPQLVAGALDDLAACFPAYAKTCRVVGAVPDAPAVKVNVFQLTDMEGTRAFVGRLNGEYPELSFDVPQAAWSNVTPRGWSKGAAVRVLCDAIGCSTDEALVFGDAGNDVPMFRVAGHSAAVAGATPEAAAAARYHIGRCEDDAVAAAIEALVVGEWPFSD